MLVKRALVLFVIISFIVAGIPALTRAAEPNGAAGTEAFVNSLLSDPEVQQLVQAVTDGIPPGTKEQLQQVAELAVSGASPEDLREQLHLIISSLPEATQADIEQLIFRLFYVSGIGLAVGAIAKFKQHKNNPQQVHVSNAFAQLFIAAALIVIPNILATTGVTLFGSDQPLPPPN